jgi:hypothetical protein
MSRQEIFDMQDEAKSSAALRLTGSYDYRAVILSALIAIMASVAAPFSGARRREAA